MIARVVAVVTWALLTVLCIGLVNGAVNRGFPRLSSEFPFWYELVVMPTFYALTGACLAAVVTLLDRGTANAVCRISGAIAALFLAFVLFNMSWTPSLALLDNLFNQISARFKYAFIVVGMWFTAKHMSK